MLHWEDRVVKLDDGTMYLRRAAVTPEGEELEVEYLNWPHTAQGLLQLLAGQRLDPGP